MQDPVIFTAALIVDIVALAAVLMTLFEVIDWTTAHVVGYLERKIVGRTQHSFVEVMRELNDKRGHGGVS